MWQTIMPNQLGFRERLASELLATVDIHSLMYASLPLQESTIRISIRIRSPARAETAPQRSNPRCSSIDFIYNNARLLSSREGELLAQNNAVPPQGVAGTVRGI